MKPFWRKGSTLNGPFLLVNISWGDARPGLEGEADWLSFCAASFADSTHSLSPRGSMPLMHENPRDPNGGEPNGVMPCRLCYTAESRSRPLRCTAVLQAGMFSCDAHAVTDLDETAASPEDVAVAPDTFYRRSRLVRHVHYTALEHRQRLGLATEAVVDNVPRRMVHAVELWRFPPSDGVNGPHMSIASTSLGARSRSTRPPLLFATGALCHLAGKQELHGSIRPVRVIPADERIPSI